MVNQTYKKLEIIIVYRKSTEHDNKFFSFMKGYDKDSRVKVLEGQKKGFVNKIYFRRNGSGLHLQQIKGD